jgi:hypothetical protein
VDATYYLALAPDGTPYFSDAKDFNSYKIESGAEILLFTPSTFCVQLHHSTS